MPGLSLPRARALEIADFLMFWRATGYYLGIPDQYNAVLDTLGQTRIYGEIVMEKLLKPCMLHLSPEAIHMAKVTHLILRFRELCHTVADF